MHVYRPMARDVHTFLRDEQARRRTRAALLASIVATLALYVLPMGGLLGYPLLLLSTLAHELGHGLTAWAMGASFESLAIYGDGSGVARHGGVPSPLAAGAIAAGGLVGPALAAAAGFVIGRHPRASRVTLVVVAVLGVLTAALLVRNPFGIAFTLGVALLLGYVGLRRSSDASQLALVFLSVQLALSVFSRSDYLFTPTAVTGVGVMPSDTARMAETLGGTYWMWGLACGTFSVLVVVLGVWLFLRSLRPRSFRAR